MASTKYLKTYPRKMYLYFKEYSESLGAPSFCKFAGHIGVTLETLESWRVHSEFDRAYRECSEIRRDYLIDNALTRRFDPSLVKYLLDNELEQESNADTEISVKLEVIG